MGWTRLSCRLGRAWTQPTGLQAPTTRTARGAAVPHFQAIPLTNEKNQVPQLRYLIFLAGAEGLEPSARGVGVNVETEHINGGKGRNEPFFWPSHSKGGAGLVLCSFYGSSGEGKRFNRSCPFRL